MAHGLPSPHSVDIGRMFDAHGAFVHRVAARLTGSSALADDVAQEVFVLAIRRADGLVDEPGIRTWLYRAAVNVVRERYRSERRYRDALDRLAELPGAVPSAGPDGQLDDSRLGARIRSCVARLPSHHREVFVLYELEQLEGAEIAAILEIPVNTVWSRLRNARLAFREAWSASDVGAK